MKDKKRFTNSLKFKSWTYFVLFALSILLILEFFQLILIEPFYRNTLRSEIKKLTENVAKVYFSDEQEDVKTGAVYAYTLNNNACVLIFDTESQKVVSYDAIGESGCAIYNNGIVNTTFIDELSTSEENSIVLTGQFIELSSQEIMVYGTKIEYKDTLYYVFSNITLQSMNLLSKTVQGQFLIISVAVMILALLISVIFSTILSRPILKVKKEAEKMSYGNYDLHFENVDINEVQELADTLTKASDEISKTEEFQKELIANVSHDIKTPLTMIKAYAEMIKDVSGENPKKREDHLNIILSETDNLNKLVQDMLNLSKLQANSIPFKNEVFDLSGVIEDAILHFEALTSEEDVNIINEVDPELISIGDKERINEVLYNFISNALKHYGEDKQIIVKAYQKDKETIRVEVIDHGTGIDAQLLPYIWDRYFKIDKKYQRSKTGTGLGLAISKAILEAHHAKYGVISELGKGSDFYFELKSYDMENLDD